MGAPRGRLVHASGWGPRCVLVALLALGLGLRLRGLERSLLFIDEAESSLNALSILEHGYPADRYLGLPMFENTLSEPWPESEEYEFRDTSYSSRGMAVYHGWLPLYAIAVSLAWHGIGPDAPQDPPRVQHGPEEIGRRIRAARLPAVLFGVLFLWAVFLAGRELHGTDAGLVALLLATVSPQCIWLSQQARYYSAALALSTLAVVSVWRVLRRGRWRDFLLSALVFVLLFHTSSLAFAIVSLASLVLVPGILRHARARPRLLAASGIVAVGLLPWMLWSGFLEHQERIPMARSLLEFPRDYLVYARARATSVLLAGALLALFAGLWSTRRDLPRRLARVLAAAGRPVAFLVVWILAAYFGFQVLVPAASCSMARLAHVLVAAPLLLVAVALAASARLVWASRSVWLAPGLALVLLAAWGPDLEGRPSNPHESEAVRQLVEHLRTLEFAPGARIYSLPYQHFCLTYYTGLAVQSVAPVRSEFLQRHPGEVVILETASRAPPVDRESVQRLARAFGETLDEAQAQAFVPALQAQLVRAEVAPRVRTFQPEPGPQPAWFGAVCAGLWREADERGRGRIDYAADNPAMFGGSPPLMRAEFWPHFFYRFVGPEGRSGENLNYAGRMREAEAWMLPSSWIVLRCPARGTREALQ